MNAKKKQSRDTGTGHIALYLTVCPADIPKEILAAPQHSVLHVAATAEGTTHVFQALKAPIADNNDGTASIGLLIPAETAPISLLYLPKGAAMRLAVTLDANANASAFPSSSEDRRRILAALAILSSEHPFGTFIETSLDTTGLIRSARENGLDEAVAIHEVLLRRLGADSRSEILSNALIAHRAEMVMRKYRRTRMDPIRIDSSEQKHQDAS